MSDDAELLRRCVEERSESAFTELVHEQMGLCLRIGYTGSRYDLPWSTNSPERK